MFRHKFSLLRETILQAFRGVILSVGEKMGENLRHNLTTTFTALQSHSDVRQMFFFQTKYSFLNFVPINKYLY